MRGRYRGLLKLESCEIKNKEAENQAPPSPQTATTGEAGLSYSDSFHLRILSYNEQEAKESCALDLEYLTESLSNYKVTWVDTDGLADVEAIQSLAGLFNFHRLAVEDVINCQQRAKIEQYGDHHFVVMRMLIYKDVLQSEQFSLFLGQNYIVSFQEIPGDCLDPVRERIRQNRGKIRRSGPDYLFYCLIDAVIDSYFPLLERYGDVMDELEDEIILHCRRDTISRIHAIKRDLLLLRRTVWPLREVLNSLLRDSHPLVSEDTKLYLRDCYDHVVRIIDLIENYRELAADLMDLYLSMVSNRMNEVMKVLTVISTIFIPLTFIVGVYGMNFAPEDSPFNMPELKWYYGYPLVWLLMIVIVITQLVFFYRKGWLTNGK